MEEVLHLFITNNCRHNCPLCCNKFYKIDEIPVVTVELLKSVQTVCLTGGEPFSINHDRLAPFIENLREQYPNVENLYIYTSGKEFGKSGVLYRYLTNSGLINGINVAPKDWEDWVWFAKIINDINANLLFPEKNSNRLYVFNEKQAIFNEMKLQLPPSIKVVSRQWNRVFNTPPNEHFARLPILFD